MLTVSVQEYDIADVRPLFGKAADLDSVSICRRSFDVPVYKSITPREGGRVNVQRGAALDG